MAREAGAYEAGHAGDYPETAGWALGTLDPADRDEFGEHLRSCEYCQNQVAGFTPAAKSLALAAPAAEPPADLELKVLAAVQYAALAAAPGRAAATAPARAWREPGAAPRARRWWHVHWSSPMYAALAAAAATAAVFVGTMLAHSTPAVTATVTLRAQSGFAGSGTATASRASGGFDISLTVRGLPVSRNGQFYECWYAGPGNRPGHPELITAGTFTVGGGTVGGGTVGGGTVLGGTAQTFHMWSAADPAYFKVMQVTLEQPGDAAQHGQVILSGVARP